MNGIITTYTGKRVDLEAPDSYTIDLEDIAVSLSRTARFNGHTTHFYSVAHHSLCMAKVLKEKRPELRLRALLHDAHEAYIGDIPLPASYVIGYGAIERLKAKLDRAIFKALLVPPITQFEQQMLRGTDRRMLITEAEQLIKGAGEGWDFTGIGPFGFPWLREEIQNPMPEEMIAGFFQYEVGHLMEQIGG